jgi:hypothetical protein
MLKSIIIVVLLAQLVAAYVILVQNIKAMKNLQKASESLKNSINVKVLSENVKKDARKHVYLGGYDRIKFLR